MNARVCTVVGLVLVAVAVNAFSDSNENRNLDVGDEISVVETEATPTAPSNQPKQPPPATVDLTLRANKATGVDQRTLHITLVARSSSTAVSTAPKVNATQVITEQVAKVNQDLEKKLEAVSEQLAQLAARPAAVAPPPPPPPAPLPVAVPVQVPTPVAVPAPVAVNAVPSVTPLPTVVVGAPAPAAAAPTMPSAAPTAAALPAAPPTRMPPPFGVPPFRPRRVPQPRRASSATSTARSAPQTPAVAAAASSAIQATAPSNEASKCESCLKFNITVGDLNLPANETRSVKLLDESPDAHKALRDSVATDPSWVTHPAEIKRATNELKNVDKDIKNIRDEADKLKNAPLMPMPA